MNNCRVLVVAGLFLMSACATPYQKTGFAGGFSETQLGENLFRVTFKGNAYTSRERASDFTLLRSAELVLEKGFRYFVIVDSEKHSKTGMYTTPSTSHTTGSAYVRGNYVYGSATTTTTGGQTLIYSKPSSSNTILAFNERPTSDDLVYEADFVVKSLKAKYEIRE